MADSHGAPGGATKGTEARIDQYLSFELGEQLYGVDILRVQEIKGWERPTRLPHAPEHVQGVINLRGSVVPIVDLRRRFGLPGGEPGRTTVVIVVSVQGARGELTAGLVVDAVCEVCGLPADSVRPAPTVGTSAEIQFVRGLASAGDRMLVLLDVQRLISATLQDPAPASQAA